MKASIYLKQKQMQEVELKDLKKGEKFRFCNKNYEVNQSFKDWRNNDDPYLKTKCGEYFFYGELKVEKGH